LKIPQRSILNIKRLRVPLGFLFGSLYLLVLFLSKPTTKFLIPGLILIFAGEMLRVLSSGYIKKSEELSVYGPYSHLRHPLYTGSFLIGLGFLLLIFNTKNLLSISLIILFLILFPAIYIKTIKEEEKFLKEKFGEEFLEYKKNVGIIFPRLKPYRKGGKFCLKQFLKNKEYRAVSGILLLLLLYFFRLHFF